VGFERVAPTRDEFRELEVFKEITVPEVDYKVKVYVSI